MENNSIKNLIDKDLYHSTYYPYLRSKLFSREQLINYEFEQIKSDEIYVHQEGFGTFKHLQWDSEVLNIPVGKISFLSMYHSDPGKVIAVKQEIIRHFCKKYPSHYISMKVNALETTSIIALEKEGFNLIDSLIYSSRDVNNYEYIPATGTQQFVFRPAKNQDFDTIIKIAGNSFLFDRFHNDHLITTKQSDALHSSWSKNSLNKKAADEVLVCEDNGEVVAFLDLIKLNINELNLKIGDYGLGATLKSHQKRGIFLELNKLSLYWFNTNGVDFVQMSTQFTNIPSAKTYLGPLGFQLSNSFYTFRKYSPGAN